ncbi:peptidoglycan DD-metalloendopeptidase family protein [Paenibacillaceae bacterium WGS1546]|uniref:M23 family metallopeptidase n=1 Tax=Cohnella sp. WGS1546 TaxID=3366810 RepID=UPI00372D4CD9
MAHNRRKAQWSLILIRDAERRVRQFRVSGRTVAFLPVATALAVAGGITGIELHAAQRIQELESLLGGETARHARESDAKDGRIAALNEELRTLNAETEHLQNRLNELRELEAKLRRFIGAYGEGVPTAPGDAVPPSAEIAASALSAAPLSDRLSADAVEATIADFAELSRMLDEMAVTMEANLRKAEQRQAELDAMPSAWPTVSRRMTSGFGYRRDPFTGKSAFHAGVDITGDIGDPIYAAGDGRVAEAGFNRTRGNYIIISHRNGLESWYMHLSKIGVREKQQVKRGDPIGEMGNSGRSTGPHLHFQIVSKEEPVNPLPYLNQVKED